MSSFVSINYIVLLSYFYSVYIRAPPKVAKYVKDLFVTSVVTVKVIDDEKELKKEFPLFAAVNRAASGM